MNWDFIAIGDMHLRDDQPPCRTDDFWKTQHEKVRMLHEIQIDNERIISYPPILQPGDLFHKWNSSHYLVQWCMSELPEYIYTIPGNHDLPNHNMDLLSKSAYMVLCKSRKICMGSGTTGFYPFSVSFFPYGYIPPYSKFAGKSTNNDNNIALIHAFVYKDKEPFPGCAAPKAKQFLKQFKGFDVIISGDNHQQFEYETENQLLINPGCFTRQRYDEKDTVPCAYLVNASQRKFEKIPLGAKNNVFQIPFEEDKKRKKKINLFVEGLKDQKEIGLSFEDNLKAFIHKNKVPKNIQSKIQEIVQ